MRCAIRSRPILVTNWSLHRRSSVTPPCLSLPNEEVPGNRICPRFIPIRRRTVNGLLGLWFFAGLFGALLGALAIAPLVVG